MDDDIMCPLLSKRISLNTCFDIAMVSEDMAPIHTAPEDATKIENFKTICLNCNHHKE